jgi:cytochrome c-type biogenesis protein
LPFIVIAVVFRRAAGALGFIKQHYALVMRFGGGMLVVVGLFMVTGWWGDLTSQVQGWISQTRTVL